MAFFKISKKKKDDSINPVMPFSNLQVQQQNAPTEQVLMMRQHGYTSNQIVQTLQSQGYESNQIYDAISQAGLNAATQAEPQNFETGMSEYGQGYEQPYEPQPVESFQTSREIQNPVPMGEERIQEVAEAIIDEKWQEFTKDIKKVIEWKEKTDERISKLEQQMLDIKLSIDNLTKSIMGKISSYDQNIVDVGTEVKAMEKVFQKVLPTLTESVNKLDRMTKGYKEPADKDIANK